MDSSGRCNMTRPARLVRIRRRSTKQQAQPDEYFTACVCYAVIAFLMFPVAGGSLTKESARLRRTIEVPRHAVTSQPRRPRSLPEM